MDNGPISVSAPGKSLIGATSQDITFSTRFPFAKLDSTNPVSFEVLTIFFNNEPPDPSSSNTNKRTLVLSYPHGYTYTPSSWFLISIDNFRSVSDQEGGYIVGSASGTGINNVTVPIIVDSENVNIYIDKFWGSGSGSPPHIVGYFVTIRAYIFVEDLLGNSVPSHA